MKKPQKPQEAPRIPMDDYLSQSERSILHSMQRHTVAHSSRAAMQKPAKRKRRHSLSLTLALAALSLAAVAPLRAAAQLPPNSAAQLLGEARAESQAGKTAPAVLDLERAQWLAPHDATVANQLASTRAQAGLTVPEPTPLSRATHALSFDALTALASISFLLFALLIFGTRLIPASLRALSRKTAFGLGILTLLCATSVAARWPELHRAVVTAANPATHIAPADSSAAPFALKTGDVVRTGRTYGPFVRILSPDGHTGWIHKTSVETIIPNSEASM